MGSLRGSEIYYQRFMELEEKLRTSEEKRLKLEMQLNEMMQQTREENQNHYKKLRAQYNRFLEEDSRRQARNESIMLALERVTGRAASLAAKTERVRQLREHYYAYLARSSKKLLEAVASVKHKDSETVSVATRHENDPIQKYLKTLSPSLRNDIFKNDRFKKDRLPFTLPGECDNTGVEESNIIDAYGDGTNPSRTNQAIAIADDIMSSIYARNCSLNFKEAEDRVEKADDDDFKSSYLPSTSNVAGNGDNSINADVNEAMLVHPVENGFSGEERVEDTIQTNIEVKNSSGGHSMGLADTEHEHICHEDDGKSEELSKEYSELQENYHAISNGVHQVEDVETVNDNETLEPVPAESSESGKKVAIETEYAEVIHDFKTSEVGSQPQINDGVAEITDQCDTGETQECNQSVNDQHQYYENNADPSEYIQQNIDPLPSDLHDQYYDEGAVNFDNTQHYEQANHDPNQQIDQSNPDTYDQYYQQQQYNQPEAQLDQDYNYAAYEGEVHQDPQTEYYQQEPHEYDGNVVEPDAAQYDGNQGVYQQYDENGQPVQYYDGNYDANQYYNDQGATEYYDGGAAQQQYDESEQQVNYTEEQLQQEVSDEANQPHQNTSQHSPIKEAVDDDHSTELEPEKVASNVMQMLDTDTESLKQDTKISNDSDFDISNA